VGGGGEEIHGTVRKEAETSKYVFLLLRSRGMYVQLVPTFETCSWKQHNIIVIMD